MVDAPPGSWIALADPAGNVLAWWGEAPSRMPPAPKTGVLAVRWSATQLELSHWRVAGSEPFTGIVCVARLLPVQSPDFGRALGLGRKATVWEPAAPEPGLPVLLADAGGAPLVAARYAGPGLPAGSRARALTLAAILALCLPLLAFRPAVGRRGPRARAARGGRLDRSRRPVPGVAVRLDLRARAADAALGALARARGGASRTGRFVCSSATCCSEPGSRARASSRFRISDRASRR